MIVSAGAASAAFGIFQYGILHYDQLGQRPQGTLGHYMTYSGLLMLVIGVGARAHPVRQARSALGRARHAGARRRGRGHLHAQRLGRRLRRRPRCCFSLKDFRLLALLPIVAALFFALAPADDHRAVHVDLQPERPDQPRSGRDAARGRAHGPRASARRRRTEHGGGAATPSIRDPDAVEQVNPHLHNVPVQIAAERGLPALASGSRSSASLVVDLVRAFRDGRATACWPPPALAAMVAMLAAGLFEYNFGDSEFLMLFLLLVTLPFAAARARAGRRARMTLPPLDAGARRATRGPFRAAAASSSSATSCSIASSSAR